MSAALSENEHMEKRLNFNDIQDLFNKALSETLENKEHDLKAKELEDVFRKVSESIGPASDEISEILFQSLRESQSDAVEDWEGVYSDFEIRHTELWKNALSSLHALIIASQEAGEAFAKKYLEEERGNKLLVLVALHARSIQVANEVLCLLKSGYADGAHARWRTAHEIAVVASFLARCSEVTVRKYLEHEAVESYKAMQQYQEHAESLELEPYSDNEISELEELKVSLVNKYGKEFLGSYGWAARKLNVKKPTFYTLEAAVGIDHLRPYYRMASHNVHANPKGINFRLGLSDGTEMFLSGPSNYGLSDPGQGIAITLGQINVSLLHARLNMDSLVYSKVLMKFVNLVQNEFSMVDRMMKENTLNNQVNKDASTNALAPVT